MRILGAGLNGCIAAYKFPNAEIHEYLNTPSVHRAVLRFRTDEVSALTGIPFKKVNVTKGIVWDGYFVNPNIQLCNLYARKVTGKASGRSITDLSPSVRYIAPDDFHATMLAKLHKRIKVNSDYVPRKIDEPTISTIPLPVLCDKLGIKSKFDSNNDARPIFVRTIRFENADLYQTIYYPNPEFSVYRASMSGDMLIIEGMSEVTSRDCMKVISDFGLSGMAHKFEESITQNFGKFVPLENVPRKRLMLYLTDRFGVYSLGRHATWRKLMLDDTPKDLEVIRRLIEIDEYDLRTGNK